MYILINEWKQRNPRLFTLLQISLMHNIKSITILNFRFQWQREEIPWT